MSHTFSIDAQSSFSLDDETAPGGIVVHYADGNGEIVYANRLLANLVGCSTSDEFLQFVDGSFTNFVHPHDLVQTQDALLDLSNQANGVGHVHYRVRTKSGGTLVVDDFTRLVRDKQTGRLMAYAFVVEVVWGGALDWLTRLPGMTRFHELAQEHAALLAQKGVKPAAVVFNIMGMKDYNTRFGRIEGDRVLRSFGDALRRAFGAQACSRFSEDNFYAFAPVDGLEQTIADLFDEFEAAQADVALPVRAGVYVCDADDDIVEVGFDRAKIACDMDRLTWESHVTWFADHMREAAHLRMHVLGSLDQAIREGWIRPYYQAVVRSATGDVCGEEALARWVDPTYGELRPAQFIPDLEEAGLLQRLDMHMVDCALADMVTKQNNGIEIVPVSVNISLRDLGKLDVAHEVAARADAMGISHDLLHIEFTESAAMTDFSYLKEQVVRLHELGFEVWMDDFGSGYSSLNTIQEFEFDAIKFDMGFLHGSNFQKSKIILEASVRAANKMGVGTIAEGVETEEQAVFLESIGCDMLQGYYYDGPNSLQAIINNIRTKNDLHRERYDESAYWDAVSLLSFTGLSDGRSSQGMEGVEWAPLTELPAGVMELRDGVWRVLRSNRAFDEFLDKASILPLDHSNLRANEVHADLGEEFLSAVNRSNRSGGWERTAGRMEYGSGFQFYVRHIASASKAEAYLLAAMPTMLGSALGTYGDVPVAYAVFRVILDDAGDDVVDTEYVYANNMYCEWLGCTLEDIVGKSLLQLNSDESSLWFPYCYQAVVKGEAIHDVVFSPEIGHWLSFNIVPSPMEGCCVYAFTIADDERRERDEILTSRDTSDFIIHVADVLSGSQSSEVAIGQALEMVAQVIDPDRLYVYEKGQATTSNTYEWCAPGVKATKDELQGLPNALFESWERRVRSNAVVLEDDIQARIAAGDRLLRTLRKDDVSHMVAVPFFLRGELLGYMGADDYSKADGLDTMRLLQTVASFVGARIVNHRLVHELELMGFYDALTGLYNRRGVDLAIERHLSAHGREPWALVLMDVDDFKTVNDLYGHDVGDEALRALAKVVSEGFPEGTILGRNGGDEFLAMVVGEDAARTEDYLRRIEERDLYCMHDGKRYGLSMSMGFVLSSQAANLKQAYGMADAALYAIKLEGKARYKQYSERMDVRYRSQLGFTPRDIANNIPGAIVVHKPDDGQILFANDELIRMFECDNLEDFMAYTGGTFAGMVHPDDRECVRAKMAAQLMDNKTGDKGYGDYRILTKAGRALRVADNGRLVDLEGMGKVMYDLIVNRDERRRW